MSLRAVFACNHTREDEQPATCRLCYKRVAARGTTRKRRACLDCDRPVTVGPRCARCGRLRAVWRDDTTLRRVNGVIAMASEIPLTEIARRCGITPDGARTRVRREYGAGWATLARRSAGMSRADVAAALGVTKSRVKQWVDQGRLADTQIGACRSVSPNDLYDALFDTLALYTLHPAGEWVAHVREARALIPAQFITKQEVCALLAISRRTLEKCNDFPAPAAHCAYDGRGYWRRSEVRAWLLAHPDRITTAARKEFGL